MSGIHQNHLQPLVDAYALWTKCNKLLIGVEINAKHTRILELIDEVIAGFTERTPEAVDIPSRPVPIGYNLWVLADKGYVLDYLFHVKEDKKY